MNLSESIFDIFWRSKRPSEMQGLSEGRRYENLKLVLAKIINPKEERGQSPRVKVRRKRILIPPSFATWANKPHDTVSKLVLQRLDLTSTKELERGVLQAVSSDTNL